MRILTDHNIPEALSRELELLGHEVSRVRDLLRSDTSDVAIDFVGAREAFVVVTSDKDFQQLPAAMPHGQQRRMRRAGRIVLEMPGTRMVDRVRDLHELILFVWEWSQRGQRDFRIDATLTTIWIRDRRSCGGSVTCRRPPPSPSPNPCPVLVPAIRSWVWSHTLKATHGP